MSKSFIIDFSNSNRNDICLSRMSGIGHDDKNSMMKREIRMNRGNKMIIEKETE